jgi:hypothetical protein
MQEDIRLGKKLASGGFGTVYSGELLAEGATTTPQPVIVKKATEFGEAEVGGCACVCSRACVCACS